MFLKNVVRGLTDFLHVLSCGNEKATCVSVTPIELIQRLIKGSPLDSILVGPSGMWRHSAEMAHLVATNVLEAEKHQLTLHKAWLILQRERLESAGRETGKNVGEALRSFTVSIRSFEERIEAIEQRMAQIRKTG